MLGLTKRETMRGGVPLRLKLLAARLTAVSLLCLAASAPSRGQNVQFTQGSVSSGLDNSISIPIVAHPGRGAASLPITLYYSSKVWRVGHLKTVHANVSGYSIPRTVAEAAYAEHSAAGWTTSLDVPEIEWPKLSDLYWYDGKPYHNSITGTYRVANVYVHMPDGSTHELRSQDEVYQNQGYVQQSGDFYAVDGSRLRFDNRPDVTPTLYLPDGSRYEFRADEQRVLFIDRHGNMLDCNTASGVWTDTQGRAVGRPWPANPQPGVSHFYTPHGYAAPYTFKWEYLSNVLTPNAQGQTPTLKAISDHYLPQPGQEPTNQGGTNFPQPAGMTSLFSSGSDPNASNEETSFTNVVGRGQTAGALFNPVVLSEVVLPNGLSYRFTYNEYGEIDKVVYPTGGSDQYTYGPVGSIGPNTFPYSQGSRGIKRREQNADEPGAVTSVWTYAGGGAYVKVTAPDETVTESYRHNFFSSNGRDFGYQDARNGLIYDERIWDKDPSAEGAKMLRRTLTKWGQTARNKQLTYPSQPQTITNYTARRNPRPERSVSFMLDAGGQALAKLVTYGYDTNNVYKEVTTGFDRTLMTESHFAVVGLNGATADVADQQDPTSAYPASLFPQAGSTLTTYQEAAAYRDRYLLGLATSVTLKDAAGNPVAKTETEYDQLPVTYYNDIPDDPFRNPGASAARGNPTTVRRYVNASASVGQGEECPVGVCLQTRAQFDQYGNPVNFWDERGVESQQEYAAAYRHAYLTKTISAAPDPSGAHGSQTAFISESTYEAATGLVLTTKDANDQVTTFSYDIDPTHRDPLNRRRKVTRPDGSWTKTDYNDVAGNLYVHTETQLEAGRTTHAYQFFDKLGRVSRTFAHELGTHYILTETRYDMMGRVSQTSNPIRTTISGAGNPNAAAHWTTAAQPALWTQTEYDELSRVKKVTLPDDTFVMTEYDGVYTTVTDQAGRQRRQKVDALGRIIRVDEPDQNGNLDPVGVSHQNSPVQPSFYEYDALGNVVRISQGFVQQEADPEESNSYVQHRYFRYDALSRLTHEKQAEQSATIDDATTGQPFWSRRLTYDEPQGVVSNMGLLSKTEDARHVYSFFHYDRLGRNHRVDYSDGTPSVTSRYDEARPDDTHPASEPAIIFRNKGRLTEVTTGTATTAEGWTVPQTQQLYDYDLMGRARRQRQVVGADTYELRYGYNLGGGLISERYPSGRVVTYGYDDAGRLLSAGSGGVNYVSAMTYNSFGAQESMTLGNGAALSMSYSDERLQLSSITLTHGTNVLQKYEYKYGTVNMATGAVDETRNNGQIARIESTVGAQRLWHQRFEYDALGRLSAAGEFYGANLGSRSYLLNYDYDVYGNRYQKSARNLNDQVAQAWVENGAYAAATNRFVSSNMTYDEAGNLTMDSQFRQRKYEYDANNRQRRSSNLNDMGAVQSVYDGTGQRVATVTAATGAITRVMVYDTAGDLVAEYGGGVSANGTQYVMGDQQGSTRLTMSSAPLNNQLISARQDYLPFGEEVSGSVGPRGGVAGYAQQTGPRQKYAGMEQDDSTKMSHTLWREFDSMSARWSAPDPYGGSMEPWSPQSFNRYTYVNNDPVNKVDPTGLMLQDIGVTQVNSAGEASILQGASDSAWKKEINRQYAAEHGLKVVTEQVAGGTRYSIANRQQRTNAAFVAGMAASGTAGFKLGFFDGGAAGADVSVRVETKRFEAYRNGPQQGVAIRLLMTGSNSRYVHFNWVQYVTSNHPLEDNPANKPYLDGIAPTPASPFYFDEQYGRESAEDEGQAEGGTIIFYDQATRSYTGTNKYWRAHLSLVGVKSDGTFDILKSFTYGFTLSGMGVQLRPLRQVR